MTKNTKNNTDEVLRLINLVASGDSDAFTALVEIYKPLLNKALNTYTTDEMSREDIEDLEQEELVAFYRAIITFDQEREGVEFGLYAKICITNSMISYRRAVAKKASRIAFVDEDDLEKISDPSQEVSRLVAQKESEQALGEKIEKTLSEYENEVWAYYVLGHSSLEIATRLGVSEKSVDNAIFRIRKKLKALLGGE
jgi:RNA polymerase sporulation-specific sigma factor